MHLTLLDSLGRESIERSKVPRDRKFERYRGEYREEELDLVPVLADGREESALKQDFHSSRDGVVLFDRMGRRRRILGYSRDIA